MAPSSNETYNDDVEDADVEGFDLSRLPCTVSPLRGGRGKEFVGGEGLRLPGFIVGDTIRVRGMSGMLSLSNDFALSGEFHEIGLVVRLSKADELFAPSELPVVNKPRLSLLAEYPLGLPRGDGGLNDRDEDDADPVGDGAFPGEPALGATGIADWGFDVIGRPC